MIPKFAVVGRVNEGKSSVIATLTENDQIAISPTPGTTTRSRRFEFKCNGQIILEVHDTPGFQEPERAYAWLQDNFSGPATGRPDAIRTFVETFAGTDDFIDECELLQPILAGAAILYVVDASHPYRASYEAEFEILRWTGRPRMVLINSVRDTDHSSEWKKSLSQHFNLMFAFNAHKADFNKRIELLTAMRPLDQDLSPAIDKAIEIFAAEKIDRVEDSARLIAAFLEEVLTFKLVTSDSGVAEIQGVETYRKKIRQLEMDLRRDLRQRFNFSSYFEKQAPTGIADEDVFSEKTWRVLGLSAKQLVTVAATAGATVGLGVDVAFGGHSLFLGAAIGALAAAGPAVWWANDAPKLKQYGVELSGTKVSVGPIKSPNWPWLLLDRSLIYLAALMGRTHAMSGDLAENKEGFVTDLPPADRNKLGKSFVAIRKSRPAPELVEQLTKIISAWDNARK